MTQLTADAGTTYFKIICGLGEVRPDGADGDANPDLMTMSGTVVLSMAADRVRYVDGAGRVRMLVLEATTYTIQASTGELIDPQGNVGVWLMNSASPGVDPSGFTYTATVTPAVGKPWAVTFSGDQTGTLDLVTIANVPSDTGVASLTARVTALEAAPSGGGVTDHGALTGLADDDHPQYLNIARGDARYYTESEVDTLLAGKADALGVDDNYVTDSEKTKLANLSGTNTGDQDLSGLVPKSLVDAKGDLIVATAADTVARLAAGTNDHVLVAASGETGGLKYVYVHSLPQTINAQTGTTYTLAAGDVGKLVTCTNAAAITVTLPQDSDATIPVGSRVDVAVLGAGMVTFAAGTGATANGTPSLVTRAQYSGATCYKRAANTWLVIGDLA